MNILKINNLNRRYGKIHAVNNLSLEVAEGNVYGILGPNGSGKTTTLGMILDVVSPTSGSYQWFGDEKNSQARKKIGAILEMPAFYPYLSAKRNLRIAAEIKEKGKDRINEVLRQVGLYDRRNDKFKTYSLGMKQRLSIASALLADPPVLILDEPTNGLDPQGIAEIRELIKSIAANGKTILFASHILDEVQKVCTHFAVLKFGRKIYDGSVEEAMKQKQVVELRSEDIQNLQSVLNEFNAVEKITELPDSLEVHLNNGADILSMHQFLIDRGIILTHLTEQKISLEKKFLSILEESNDPTA